MAPNDMCQILKGLPLVKSDTITAVELLMEIFKKVRSKEEIETDAQRKRSNEAVDERGKKADKAEMELKGIWTAQNKINLANDNLCTTKAAQITHSINHLLHKKTQNLVDKKRSIQRGDQEEKGGQTSLKITIHQQG